MNKDDFYMRKSYCFYGKVQSNTSVKRMANQRFNLCLAGHTYGGQLAIGGWAPYTPVGSGRFVAGFYDVPDCSLFVSRGARTSVVPLRLGARAKVVVFEM